VLTYNKLAYNKIWPITNIFLVILNVYNKFAYNENDYGVISASPAIK